MKLIVIMLLLMSVGVVLAAGGKNRGDDPYDNPGDNPCFDENDEWICGERPVVHCDAIVIIDDDIVCVLEEEG